MVYIYECLHTNANRKVYIEMNQNIYVYMYVYIYIYICMFIFLNKFPSHNGQGDSTTETLFDSG